jgi:hypothetical protein
MIMFSKNGAATMSQQNEIKVEIDSKVAEGTYANLAIIAHSDCEFIIDFAKLLPGTPGAKVHSRILLTPKHAKLLMTTLAKNLENFEDKFGEIRIEGDTTFPHNISSKPVVN